MDKKYMARALELAALGEGSVNPNPGRSCSGKRWSSSRGGIS